MDKLYNRTNWVDDNAPDIDADHLNNIESGIDAIDDRVIELNDGLSDLAYGENAGGNNLLDFYTIADSTGNAFENKPIKLDAGTYTVSSVVTPTDLACIGVFYAENKTTEVGRCSFDGNNNTFTLSANARYWRLYFPKSGTISNMQIEKGTVATPFHEYIMSNKQLTGLNNTLSDYKEKGFLPSNNLVGKDTNHYYPIDGVNNSTIIIIPKTGTKPTTRKQLYVYNADKTQSDYFNIESGTTQADGTRVVNIQTSVNFTVAYAKWVNYDESYPLMVAYGSTKVPFEEYVMSNADLTSINESLDDYGMNNVFDGVWNQDTEGKIVSNYYAVSAGNTVKVGKCNGTALMLLYNSSKQWRSNVENVGGKTVTIPNDIAYFRILLSSSVSLTPQTAEKIHLYINSEIDQVKTDLISKDTITATTTGNGNVTGIPSDRKILSCKCNSAAYLCIPFNTGSSSLIKVLSDGMSIVSNTSVTIEYYYTRV